MTPAQQAQLEAARAQIDTLDDALLDLLERRSTAVAALWAWKHEEGLPRTDPAREQAVIDALVAKGLERGLEPDALRSVLATIIGRRLR